MMVQITSGPRGSNPGGKCTYFDSMERRQADGYFKYVLASQLAGPTNFTHVHQPIYEQVTLNLAESLGLHVPRTAVLLNWRNDVKFLNWREHLPSNPEGRKYYFVSQMVPHPRMTERNEFEREVIDREVPYVKALLISDIIGKRDNYSFTQESELGKVTYLDVGCSFVHAKEGFLRLHHKLKIRDEKDFKRAMKKLQRRNLILANSRDSVPLDTLIESLPIMLIPMLNPSGFLPLERLIRPGEIEEIKYHIVQGFVDALPDLERRKLIG